MGDTDKTTAAKGKGKARKKRAGRKQTPLARATVRDPVVAAAVTPTAVATPETPAVVAEQPAVAVTVAAKPPAEKKKRPLPARKEMSKFTTWAAQEGDEEEDILPKATAFLAWCDSDAQAKIIIAAIDYDTWYEFLRPVAAARCTLDTGDKVLEQIEQIKTGAKNKKMQQKKAIVTFDASTYECPGRLLSKWDVDLDRVHVVHYLTAAEMKDADLKFEAADWELKNNTWDEDDTAAKAARVERKQEATATMLELIKRYEGLEVERQKEDAKAGEISAILLSADALQPAGFRSNALCQSLWTGAKASPTSTGLIQPPGDYSASVLKSAWLAWKAFQKAVETTPVKGFQTWAIGNGKAQDKSERADIALRRHTFQMNFAVVFKGVTQMIHVGLAGTNNPSFH